jgi:hypothetical protein
MGGRISGLLRKRAEPVFCTVREKPRTGTSGWSGRYVQVMKARRLQAAGLAAAVASVLAAGITRATGDDYDNGPFGHTDSSYGWSIGAGKGDVFTDGMHVLQNLGDRPVRLVSVAFEDGEPGLELVGAKVAGLDRAIGSYQMLPSFPPVSSPPDVDLGPLKDLAGYVIPAGGEYRTHGVELLLGVRKDVDGRASRRALLITYEVDGERAVARMVGELVVCPAGRNSCADESAGGA